MTRVLIVAPSAVVRAGLESILTAGSDMEVAGSVPALDHNQMDTLDPDVVLIDLEQAGDADGSVLLPSEAGDERPAFVVLTALADATTISSALRAGVRAVLARGAGAGEIRAAVEAAAAGLVVFHADSAALLPLMALEPARRVQQGTESLTPREIEVLRMMAEGTGNKLIARRLGISEHTVKFHVGSILAKLGAGSRTEAVTVGVRLGLIMV